MGRNHGGGKKVRADNIQPERVKLEIFTLFVWGGSVKLNRIQCRGLGNENRKWGEILSGKM